MGGSQADPGGSLFHSSVGRQSLQDCTQGSFLPDRHLGVILSSFWLSVVLEGDFSGQLEHRLCLER
jgi:hypothetical protein